MKPWLMGVLSFLIKEVHEIRRQPVLLLSLIGGPFLVLALFGAAFRSPNPVLRTVLVWPEGGIAGVERKLVEDVVNQNFHLIKVVSDEEEAMLMLADREVEVVQVVPQIHLPQSEENLPTRLQIYSHTIDPNIELWLQSVTYIEATYINRQILLQQTRQAQKQALSINEDLNDAEEVLSGLEVNLSEERRGQALRTIRTLRSLLSFLLALMPASTGDLDAAAPRIQTLRDEAALLLDDLNELDQTLRSGEIQEQSARFQEIAKKLNNLQNSVNIFANLPPNEIVFPLQPHYTNLRGKAYAMAIFYAPGVLTLLIQHLAVVLGALALVRERQKGAFELFRVAPLDIPQLMLGKTLAYSMYVLVAGVALTLLLRLLDVPFLGSIPLIITLVVLLTLASVGVGLLISAISGSDSQAIQLTMILLMFSIFFSGFFLSLNSFKWLARPISAVLPMTHGLAGLQALMLIGQPPDASVWLGLVLIAMVVYGSLYLVLRRIFHKGIS